MDHACIVALMALVPIGGSVAMGEGMILHFLARAASSLPPWMRKPLYACPRCMVSAWGIPSAFLVFPHLNPWLLPVYLLAAVGLQDVIDR